MTAPQRRIMVLTTSFPRYRGDDAGIFVERLVQQLSAHGNSITVVAPYDPVVQQQPPSEAAHIVWYRYGVFTPGKLAFGAGIIPNIRNNPLLVGQLPGLLVAMTTAALKHLRQCEVIHANWILAAVAAWGVSLVSGRPYIVSLRGSDVALLSRMIPLARKVLMRAARTVVVSDQLQREVLSILPELASKLSVIYNGVYPANNDASVTYQRRAAYGLGERPYLLFVGSIIARKRVEILCEILSDPQLSNYDLVLCGRLDEERYVTALREKVEARGLASRVRFLGLVPPNDIPALLAGAHAYITASEYEGRPNSVLEALAHRVPVFASDIPAHRELITPDQNGFLFSPDDLQSAASNIVLLASNVQRRQEITEAGFVSTSRLSWERCATAYEALFANAVSGAL